MPSAAIKWMVGCGARKAASVSPEILCTPLRTVRCDKDPYRAHIELDEGRVGRSSRVTTVFKSLTTPPRAILSRAGTKRLISSAIALGERANWFAGHVVTIDELHLADRT